MSTDRAMALVAFLALLGAGCVIDTVPLPDETIDETGDSDRGWDDGNPGGLPGEAGVDTSALYYTAGTPSLLVGAMSAVPPSMGVRVSNRSQPGWLGETTAAEDGSFFMPMAAAAGEELLVEVLDGDGIVVTTAVLQLEPPSAEASRAFDDASYDGNTGDPSATPVVITVTAPDAEGVATVTGSSGVLSSGIVVVVANVDGGNAASTQVQADGGFTARIAAQSGDELAILLAEAAVSNASAGSITHYVP